MSPVRFVDTPLREDASLSWVSEIRVTFLAVDEADAAERLEQLCDALIANDAVWEINGGILGEHHQNAKIADVIARLARPEE